MASMYEDGAANSVPAVTAIAACALLSKADEANHRISNSLQLLSGMLEAEARSLCDEGARAAFERMRHRINAIAGVHDQLCRTRGEDAVDLGRYVHRLGHQLELSLENGGQVVVEADTVAVTADDARAIGIILVEVITNACKYAYPDGAPGNIRLLLARSATGGCDLTVEDRGQGRSGQVAADGLGTRFIQMSATTIGATIAWEDAGPGTRFSLCIPAL